MPPLPTRVFFEDSSDSESPCAVVGQSLHSLSSMLSTDSLQVQLSFPDLQIQEPGEAEDRNQEVEEASGPLDGKKKSPEALLFLRIAINTM